ncbi:MAG: hypothetical protein ACI9XU_000326, partial [Arenicella sp.]
CGNATFPADLTANSGESSISLFANGVNPNFPALAAGASCTVGLDVTAVSGTYNNISSSLVEGGVDSGKASATLNVPIEFISKSFIDDPIAPGTSVILEYNLNNLNRSSSATAVAFSDDLAATLASLTFSSLLANDCGGSVGGVGTTNLTFSGGTIAAQGSCTIRANVSLPSSATIGTYTSNTSAATATVGGSPFTGNTASDRLVVSTAPTISVAFTPSTITAGDTTTLEYTATNASSTSGATDISFSSTFPSFIATASMTPANDSCGAGSTLTFTPRNNSAQANFTMSGGNLAAAGMPGDSCTFSLTLETSTDASTGLYPVVAEGTATVDGQSQGINTASASIVVTPIPELSKDFTDDPVAPGGSVTLEYRFNYSADAAGPATNISFTDDLNAALAGLTANLPVLPDPPCGAGSSFTGSAGDTLLTLMGGTLAPGEECVFSVTLDVPAASTPATMTSTTSAVTATVSGLPVTGAAATSDLVVAGITFESEFLDNPYLPGDMATLRFMLANISNSDDITDISFSDNLSTALSGLTIVAPLPTTPCGASSMLAQPGASFMSLTAGQLAVGEQCSFDVTVQIPVSAANGEFVNSTSDLTATFGGTAGVANNSTSSLVINNEIISLTKEFSNSTVVSGGTTNLRFTLTNLDAIRAISDVAFSDDLDAALSGLTVTGLPISACGGTVAAIPTAGTIDFSGGTLTAGEQCQFDVPVSIPGMSTSGIYTNTTSSLAGLVGMASVSGQPASDVLTVVNFDVDFSKAFAMAPVQAGGNTSLEFTITNNDLAPLTRLAFTDDLDAVVTGLVATGLPLTDVCGTGSTISGTSSLTLIGGNVAGNGTCTFSVDLLIPSSAAVPGTFSSASSQLTENSLTANGPAIASITISPTPPTFTKVFTPNSVVTDQVSVLRFTIDNSASAVAATALTFTDNLPAGLVVSPSAMVISTCSGGTVTAMPGSSVINLTGSSAAASATCNISVNVQSALGGVFVNTSGELTSSAGNSGTASATLTVDDDIDNDTIPNAIDNCPNDANISQADLDNDNLGDACDNDSDNDQMPDDYEIANGLDPFNSFDQQGDPDGDGFSNLEEFLFGTDPNIADLDENNNGVPDSVDQYRMRAIIPNILLLLILEKDSR